MLEKGKKYIEMPPRDFGHIEETTDELGNTIYNVTTKIIAEFSNQQEDFIFRTITKIGEEYGVLFVFNKEKIADALQKRTKKKVKITDAYPHRAYCPGCYTTLNLNIESIQNLESLPGFCSCCGQALDWEDLDPHDVPEM